MWQSGLVVVMIVIWGTGIWALLRVLTLADKAGAYLSYGELVAYLKVLALGARLRREELKRLGPGLRYHRSILLPVKVLQGALIAWFVLGVGAAAVSIVRAAS